MLEVVQEQCKNFMFSDFVGMGSGDRSSLEQSSSEAAGRDLVFVFVSRVFSSC